MEEKRVTRGKAIRLKCLDCCCGNPYEVKECTVEKCALHLFRMGKNPNIGKKELTDEQREARKAILAEVNRRRQREAAQIQPR